MARVFRGAGRHRSKGRPERTTAVSLSGRARRDRVHRLGRTAALRDRDGRARVHLGGGRRRRQRRRTTGQAARLFRRGQRRLAAEGRVRAGGARLRRGVQLQRRRHLEAALSALRVNGRIIACGAISAYNASEPPPGPRNLGLVIGKRLSIKGFIVTDWSRRMPEFVAETGRYLREGKLKAEETVVDGIENAPRAFLDLLNGENIGKMVVKLS